MLRFALDLTWVRHKIVGGTESFVNNLITGFSECSEEYEMVLIPARDNAELFKKYLSDKRITMIEADVDSASVRKRIIWQNTSLSKMLLKNGITLCLEPVYAKPILSSRKVRYLSVIHDLEAIHFPENHSFFTNVWLRLSWWNAANTSGHVVAISEYVRQDIIKKYGVSESGITTIFDPIILDTSIQCDFSEVAEKYQISERGYYYTVSKLNPHKNLTTLVKVFGEIKKQRLETVPCKLLISGVNGGMQDKLWEIANEYGLKDELVLTGFVSDDVRNTLYSHARAFLFPSIFEGFGMPPIEAICAGTAVITTREACIPEITQYKAKYVNDPYSTKDWIDAMEGEMPDMTGFDPDIYKPSVIAKRYLDILRTL